MVSFISDLCMAHKNCFTNNEGLSQDRSRNNDKYKFRKTCKILVNFKWILSIFQNKPLDWQSDFQVSFCWQSALWWNRLWISITFHRSTNYINYIRKCWNFQHLNANLSLKPFHLSHLLMSLTHPVISNTTKLLNKSLGFISHVKLSF